MSTANPSRRILIVGQFPDPHIDAVLSFLKKKGQEPLVFQRHSKSDTLSFHYNDRGKPIALSFDGREYAFSSIWWRMKPHVPSEFSGGDHLAGISESFVTREWREVLRSLYWITKNQSFWVNPLDHHYDTSYKPRQLLIAQEVGLTIPPTLISNSPTEILDFFDLHQKIIYKTLSSFVMPPKFVIFTKLLTREEIQGSGDQLILSPGIFQKYSEKSFELRVTVVGNKVFTARIDSQNQEETQIDWRKNQFLSIYSQSQLTHETQKKLLAFHKKCGLQYATYDFIVDPEGHEIFLECNPGGQYLWVEEQTGFAISEALADLLLQNPSSSCGPS